MKYRIIVLVIFVVMLFIINAGFVEGLAELNEEQIKNLIKEEVGELNRQDKLLGWIFNFIGIVLTSIGIFFAVKFRQHFNLDKRFGRIECTAIGN